jgi:hypothetical protein
MWLIRLSSLNDRYIDVDGRVGPGDAPRIRSGPKSKDMIEERSERCDGEAIPKLGDVLPLLRDMTVESGSNFLVAPASGRGEVEISFHR